jgi:hypothetical protein
VGRRFLTLSTRRFSGRGRSTVDLELVEERHFTRTLEES